jgi:AraC family transcriptional activator FtrA
MTRHRVAVIVPSDFTLFELGVAVEVFASPRPELEREWYDVRLCAADPGPMNVMGGLFGVSIPHGIEAIDDADTVIVPQAGSIDRPAEPSVIDAVRRAYARGARLISFCSGAFVLAASGALDGRPAATHWKYARQLALDYPRVRVNPEVLYVDDGQVLTSAGTAAGIDLSLHVIRKDHGACVARHISRSMVVAPHREGGQAQFIMAPAPNRRPQQDGVARTMDYALHHLADALSVQELAARAFMSPRNFSRRFHQLTGTTPAHWVLQQRLTRVRKLLEETDMPIEQIAAETGFGSSVTLRQRFSSTLRTTPSAYRKAFRAGFESEAS